MLNKQSADRDHGAVAIMVALLSVVLLGIAALVVDLGMAMETRRDAQKTTDLAALAGGQELPSRNAATTVVAEYLDVNGWPVVGDPLVTLNDDDKTNGEVDFAGSTKLTVYAPIQDVDFVFAGVFDALPGGSGLTGTGVSAQAAVEIRSPSGSLPYALSSTSIIGTEICLEAGSGRGAPAGRCPTAVSGNFGALQIGRAGVTGPSNNPGQPELELNTALGITQGIKVFPSPTFGQACSLNSPVGSLPDAPPWTVAFNCIGTQTGNNINPVTFGLLDRSIKADGSPDSVPCNGRITSVISGACTFAPDKLFSTYVTPTAMAAQTPKSISPEILDDPRFGIVPMMNNDDLGPGGSTKYLVQSLYGFYITQLRDNGGNVLTNAAIAGGSVPNVHSFKGYAFSLEMLNTDVITNNGSTIDYLGSGPKIPVLVE